MQCQGIDSKRLSMRRLWLITILLFSSCKSLPPVIDFEEQMVLPTPSAIKREIYHEIAAEIELGLEQGDIWLRKGDFYQALINYRHAAYYKSTPELAKKIQELEARVSRESEQLLAQGQKIPPRDALTALMLYNQAVRLNPEHQQAREARDLLLQSPGIKEDLAAREAALRQELENQPRRQESIASLVAQADAILAYQCDHPLARRVKQHIDRERADESRHYLSRGKELFAAGQLQQSKEYIQKARSIDPGNREPQALLQEIQKKQDVSYFMNLARYRLEIGDFDKAEEFSRKALDLQTDDQETIALLKRIRQARMDHALEQAQRLFTRKDWERAVAHLQRLMRDGARYEEWPEMQKTIQSALSRNIPQMVEEGKRLFGENKLTEANRVLVSVLDLDPENNVAATYLKKIQSRLETIQSLK
jgi:tetratricopeptide (TPR) repeat protein